LEVLLPCSPSMNSNFEKSIKVADQQLRVFIVFFPAY
jgi:hypothetical protein